MNKVKIVAEDSVTNNIKVIHEDQQIEGVTKIEFEQMNPNELVRAAITFIPSSFDIETNVIMSEESFLKAAKHYGYKVIKNENN